MPSKVNKLLRAILLLLLVVGLQTEFAATAAKFPVGCCEIGDEFSRVLLGVLLTSVGLLFGVDDVLFELVFNTELELLFIVVLDALIACGFIG